MTCTLPGTWSIGSGASGRRAGAETSTAGSRTTGSDGGGWAWAGAVSRATASASARAPAAAARTRVRSSGQPSDRIAQRAHAVERDLHHVARGERVLVGHQDAGARGEHGTGRAGVAAAEPAHQL